MLDWFVSFDSSFASFGFFFLNVQRLIKQLFEGPEPEHAAVCQILDGLCQFYPN